MARPKKTEESLGGTSSLQSKLKALEAKYGKGSLIVANDFEKVKDFTSTGSISLDKAIGIGGVPKNGKITQIVGLEQASKTTLSLHIIAEEQKKGNPCAFLDIEGTLDVAYAEKIGVDLNTLYIINPSKLNTDDISGEEWLNICADLVETNEFGIVVLDSIAALTPKSEFQGADTAGIGKLSRMLSQGFRLITAKLLRANCGLILLNQFRINIGGYGNPYVPAGGESIKYYTALRIDLSKSLDKQSDGIPGIVVKAKVTKNKFAPPHLTAEYYVEFGKGIVPRYEIMNLAIDAEIIKKTGNTYSWRDSKLGVGLGQLETFLEDNPEVLEEIKQELLSPKEEEVNNVSVEEVVEFSHDYEAELSSIEETD
jgi:recombination protein RecA